MLSLRTTPSKCWDSTRTNYQILGNLRWVKFFNGVGVRTHKELVLEILIH
jgi:hypothetical protein